MKHKLFPATHLARIEERPNKKLELYLQVCFDSTLNRTNADAILNKWEILYLQFMVMKEPNCS